MTPMISIWRSKSPSTSFTWVASAGNWPKVGSTGTQPALTPPPQVVIEFKDVRKAFGPNVIYDPLNLSVRRGETLTVIGGSGKGKSVMLKMLIVTGIRNDELASLAIDDVDLKALQVRVNQGKGRKDRCVPFPASFRGELAQYIMSQRARRCHFLFETHRMDRFTTRWIREIVYKYARKAGLEKRIYPHLFRHQLLTHLAKNGIPDAKIQVISGHADRQSLAIYQDLSLADIQGDYQDAMRDFFKD